MTRRRRVRQLCALARELERALDGKLDRILDRKLAHEVSLELKRAIERSRIWDLRLLRLYERVRLLESTVERNYHATASFSPMRCDAHAIRVALEEIERCPADQARLVGWAVSLLPLRHRTRYFEEYLAELADLPRVKRVPHALRLLSRSCVLRRALGVHAVKAPR
ncbi:hypothetical protein [Saccharothrix coeruleofusca]|uniref:Uncharacterized protein n=1 Tax=Saccharothrix coeruleofusca TaxID=33919 RepID=A0A918AQR5_9PSEU|nr:hypothetical protein [Saccharothrix coeruleofusca]MBP2337989.1 hypothetical protein [Saccharothrix coeruleofusca]GGP63563.1 hypothetical protein GCM10010185_40340 [Saccharothrix coeruleofusca]